MVDIIVLYASFGAVVGFAGGLVNVLLWKRTFSHKHIFGIKVHDGFGNALQKTFSTSSNELAPDIARLEIQILALFDNFMATSLTQKMPVLSMFIDDKLIDEIRVIFHAEMSANLPNLLKSGLSSTQNASGIESIASKAMSKAFKQYNKLVVLYLLLGSLAGALLGLAFTYWLFKL